MLDLISSDPDAKFWGQLREEATGVFKNVDDWTNPASVLKLSLADSTIRESLRKNPIIARSVVREVIADDGITLPSGHLIPKGAWMCAGAVGLHHDSRFYPKPEEYDPFRFAKKQDDELTETDKEALTEKGFDPPQESGPGNNERYIPGLRSRKACVVRAFLQMQTERVIHQIDFLTNKCADRMARSPGRWLAAHQLKLMLAYVTMNYDIQHTAQRRHSNYVLGDAIIPSDTATMLVRRRKHTRGSTTS